MKDLVLAEAEKALPKSEEVSYRFLRKIRDIESNGSICP